MPTKLDPLNREVLRAELIRDEGLKLKTYRCTAGKLSVGVGRNLDDVGIRPWETDKLKITVASIVANGITKSQAMALLDDDIDACIEDLDHFLPWWSKLDPVRQRVLLNMCFNLGITKLLKFTNTLRMIQQGRYADASVAMLQSAWATQVGARATRLAALMKDGPKK